VILKKENKSPPLAGFLKLSKKRQTPLFREGCGLLQRTHCVPVSTQFARLQADEYFHRRTCRR